MSRTINGKTISETLELLSRPVKKDKNYGGFEYVKIEAYYDRMNSVLGIDHYSVSYDDECLRGVLSGQELVSVKCVIEILDDNYDVVFRKEGYGATEIKYAKESGKSDGLKNIPTIACSSAFKEACKCLGIFGLRPTGFSDDTPLSSTSDQPSRGAATAASSACKKSSVRESGALLNLESIAQAQVVRKDTRSGKNTYRLQCVDKGTKKRIDVIVYPNNYRSCEETIEKMVVASNERNLSFDMICDTLPEKDGIEQAVFKQFA